MGSPELIPHPAYQHERLTPHIGALGADRNAGTGPHAEATTMLLLPILAGFARLSAIAAAMAAPGVAVRTIAALRLLGARGTRILPSALIPVLAVAVVALVPTTNAGFSATTHSLGNSLAADTLASPTSLGAVQRCLTPSVVGTTSANGSGGTVQLVVPLAAVSGDLLIAHLANDNTSSAASGWSQLNSVTTASGNLQGTLYQRIATAGDPGTTYSFTVTGNKSAGSMLVVHNVSGLVPAGQAAGLDNGGTVTVVAPSVTITAASSLLISFFSLKSGGQSFSTPSGMTEVYDPGGADVSLAADREARASAGATGTRTATASTSATSIGQSVAIAPASNPEVDLTWTPTASTWATGHEIKRNSVVVASVTPRTASSWTDTSPGAGSTTYEVRSVKGTWQSAPAIVTLTVGC